jgi:hypothetical protein
MLWILIDGIVYRRIGVALHCALRQAAQADSNGRRFNFIIQHIYCVECTANILLVYLVCLFNRSILANSIDLF